MDSRRGRTLAVVTLAVIAGGLVVGAVLVFLDPEGRSSVAGVLENKIIVGIAVSLVSILLTFLVRDRWLEVRSDIAELRKAQHTSIREIKDEAKHAIKAEVEGATRKAQALEDRIGRILDEHPWVAYITSHEFIPEAASCRIVLSTSRKLLHEGKTALLHEYVFGWVTRDSGQQDQLMGVYSDFVALSDFCATEMKDEFLAHMSLEKGYENAIDGIELAPEFLRELVRRNRLEAADRVAGALAKIVRENWWSRLIRAIGLHRVRYRVTWTIETLLALALYEGGALGRRAATRRLERVRKISRGVDTEVKSRCTEAELLVFRGDFEGAKAILDDLLHGSGRGLGALGPEIRRLYKIVVGNLTREAKEGLER